MCAKYLFAHHLHRLILMAGYRYASMYAAIQAFGLELKML